jgi:hypothetical protein
VGKHAIVGCIPRFQCLLLKQKPKPLRLPRWSSYRFVVNWELIFSPDPKGSFISLLYATPRTYQRRPCPIISHLKVEW